MPEPLTMIIAGRTDAGVHALGQVVNLPDAPDGLDLPGLRASLNEALEPDISVHGCSDADPDFSARFHARSRTYIYAVQVGPEADPALATKALHHKTPLDVAAMNEAAGHLVGSHDFSAFGRVVNPEGSPVRSLFELRARATGDIVRIRARANAFIQQMVRALAGTLVKVGEGRLDPGAVPRILEAKDRSGAGPVAPPHGLCLVSVEYDVGWSGPFDQGI
jgi:tRNA pseudouridine38-40 synthase